MGAMPILRISYDLNLKLSYGIGICITNGNDLTSGYSGPYYLYSKSIFKKRSNHSIGFQEGSQGGWASSQICINIMNLKRDNNSNDISEDGLDNDEDGLTDGEDDDESEDDDAEEEDFEEDDDEDDLDLEDEEDDIVVEETS